MYIYKESCLNEINLPFRQFLQFIYAFLSKAIRYHKPASLFSFASFIHLINYFFFFIYLVIYLLIYLFFYQIPLNNYGLPKSGIFKIYFISKSMLCKSFNKKQIFILRGLFSYRSGIQKPEWVENCGRFEKTFVNNNNAHILSKLH